MIIKIELYIRILMFENPGITTLESLFLPYGQ